ncbi:MAG: AAA family ATPase [Bacteroidales bacterium]|nr:AAA family ATPase [Bacteroidales bacterium]
MIHSLTIKNFLSFKEEVTFSFEATNDKKLENYHIVEVVPGVKLLKIGIVNGANASGKSNLLEAFEFLKEFWFNTTDNKMEKTGVIPFLLDGKTPNNPTYFKLNFYVNKKKYSYYLELNQAVVISEKLDYYPGHQPANIFTRTIDRNISKIEFGPKIKISQIAKEQIATLCLSNMSVFSAYTKVNINVPEIEDALIWMREKFMNIVEPNTRLIEYAEMSIFENQKLKKDILAYLQKADFNISDIDIKDVQKTLPDFFIDSITKDKTIPLSEVERIKNEKTVTVKEIDFLHKVVNSKGQEEHYPLNKDYQSEGTLRALGIGTVILRAIERNAFLCIDEIESKLHPRLIEFVLEQFIRNSKESQLLVATHYDGLYDEDDMFRKDNFWFTEKKQDGSTNLYSLADFRALNRISSIQKAYKLGKFGAVPEIS